MKGETNNPSQLWSRRVENTWSELRSGSELQLLFASAASNEQISLNVTTIQDESHIYTSATFKSTLKSLKYLLKKLQKVFLSSRRGDG